MSNQSCAHSFLHSFFNKYLLTDLELSYVFPLDVEAENGSLTLPVQCLTLRNAKVERKMELGFVYS